MQTKLTLSVDQNIIEKAKLYASENERSLSNIVEEFLKSLILRKNKGKKKKFSAEIQELKGSLKLPPNVKDYKELLNDARIEKYLR